MNKFQNVRMFILLILLFMTTFSYAMIEGGAGSWFLFYSLLPLEFYYLMIVLYPFKKVKVTHTLSNKVTVPNQMIDVTVIIQMPFYFPFFYFVVTDECTSIQLKRPLKHRFICYPWTGKIMKQTYSIELNKRGEYSFNSVHLLISDPFGWLKREVILQTKGTLIVYPKHYPLSNWYVKNVNHDLSKGRLFQEEDRQSVASIREYVPGDRLNMIDFKASARTGIWKTKEFDSLGNDEVWLVFDQREENGSTFEEMLAFFFSLTVSLAKTNPTLMFVNGKWLKKEGSLLPESFLYELAKAQSIDNKTWLRSFGQQSQFQGNRIIFITHELKDGDVEWLKMQQNRASIFLYFINQTDASFLHIKNHQSFVTLQIPYVLVPKRKEEEK